jgi:bacterioferritin
MGQSGQQPAGQQPFLTDVKALRERARQNLDDGALGSNYIGDVSKTIEILQSVLATEIVCVLRYTQNAITATGLSSEGVKKEFAEHAEEERQHLHMVRSASTSWAASPISIPKDC